MTFQLTASNGETVRFPQSGSELVESSKHQPQQISPGFEQPDVVRRSEDFLPNLKNQVKKSEYENATDDERKRDKVLSKGYAFFLNMK